VWGCRGKYPWNSMTYIDFLSSTRRVECSRHDIYCISHFLQRRLNYETDLAFIIDCLCTDATRSAFNGVLNNLWFRSHICKYCLADGHKRNVGFTMRTAKITFGGMLGSVINTTTCPTSPVREAQTDNLSLSSPSI
jgi:hypothetical protein